MRPAVCRRLLASALAGITLASTLGSSCTSHTAVQPQPCTPGPRRTSVDLDMAWSRDDRWLYFHRRVASSYGPAGIYRIDPRHPDAELVRVQGGVFPVALSMSFDDRYLAGDNGSLIRIIDVATGEWFLPFYTDNGAGRAAWSPRDYRIAYSRLSLNWDQPIDSAGLHVFDLATGTDTFLSDPGGRFATQNQAWSPSGTHLCVAMPGPQWEVGIYDLAARRMRPLFAYPPGDAASLQWLYDPVHCDSVLYLSGWAEYGNYTWRYSFREARLDSISPAFSRWDRLSWDASRLALVGLSSPDSCALLFWSPFPRREPQRRHQLTEYCLP